MGLILILLVLSGCASSPPVSSTKTIPLNNSYAPELVSSVQNVGPGDSVTFCTAGSDEENEKCFRDAFSTCEKAIGVFWKTSDGFSLLFETLGLDTLQENCRVRMTAADTDSQFYGQSANCIIPKSQENSQHTQPFFDVLSIDTSTCSGTYVDTIVRSSTTI